MFRLKRWVRQHAVCTRSLRDMLYRRRMERQLAQARGQMPGPERPPDEDVSDQVIPCFAVLQGLPCMPCPSWAVPQQGLEAHGSRL